MALVTIARTHLRSLYPKAIHLLPGEHGEILGKLEVGWGKVECWSMRQYL